ncbi:ethanolamine utilization protein EutH, partial [Bacillus haynesii]|uniref:ethanolamine utilization protein EutH n=1 Tax=Bacillus haynesii TaxID=1925021 RepID=UPI00228001FE
MEYIANIIIYTIMVCAVIGAFAAIKDSEKGIGKEFMEGFYAIGHVFIPCAGIMAAIPYLSHLIPILIGPLFKSIGVDPAIAATSILAVDMGGYQLAAALAESTEGWIIAMVVGYLLGPTIVFLIPVGLALLEKRDHKYMALGVMSGILTIPIGVLITSGILAITKPSVRENVTTSGPV